MKTSADYNRIEIKSNVKYRVVNKVLNRWKKTKEKAEMEKLTPKAKLACPKGSSF